MRLTRRTLFLSVSVATAAVLSGCVSGGSGRLEVLQPLTVSGRTADAEVEVSLDPGLYSANLVLMTDDCLLFRLEDHELRSFSVVPTSNEVVFPISGGAFLAPADRTNQKFSIGGQYHSELVQTERLESTREPVIYLPANCSDPTAVCDTFVRRGGQVRSGRNSTLRQVDTVNFEMTDPGTSTVLARFSNQSPMPDPRSSYSLRPCY